MDLDSLRMNVKSVKAYFVPSGAAACLMSNRRVQGQCHGDGH